MSRATDLLRGEGLPPEEADERRERLLAGFRWILIDEYQDIGPEQYELISTLAGRTLEDDDGKLTLFAVGDDDQNIYAFAGASVEYIRRFEQDYQSKATYLTANYRSSANIIEAANVVIEQARDRMKTGHPIQIDKNRSQSPKGDDWEGIDPVSRGRMQILLSGQDPTDQARVVMKEYSRLQVLDQNWNWSRCAVIASEWKYLAPVRAFCEACGIPSQMGDEEIPGFWGLRETRQLVAWLRDLGPGVIDTGDLCGWTDRQSQNRWNDLLIQAVEEHQEETGGGKVPTDHFIEWLAEWGQDIRRRQSGLLLVSAHRAKGLEFDHVAVLDGGWDRTDWDKGHPNEKVDLDERRRLYYVAMTRAKQTLALAKFDRNHPFLDSLVGNPSTIVRDPQELPPCPKNLNFRHIQPKLDKVDLGYAGRMTKGHRVHRALAELAVGDRLSVHVSGSGRWELQNRDGITVGRMSRKFHPQEGMRIREARAMAVVGRSKARADPKYLGSIKCDDWEVVVPEFIFEPEN